MADDIAFKRQVDTDPLAPVSDELKAKERWIQATIKNESQFQVALGAAPYFQYGRYWSAPDGFGGFDTCTFSVCNVDGNNDGVSAGQPFRLSLDSTHYFDFALVRLDLS